MKVHLYPQFRGVDDGDGGVRRVVEAQTEGLTAKGIELLATPDDADVIACHITIPPTYLVRLPRKPIVAHCHGLYWAEYDWQNWALEANEQVMELLRVADTITAPSEWIARVIRRHTARKVDVVPHGVDLEAWQPNTEPLEFVLWNKTRPDPVCDPKPVNAVAALMPGVQFVSTFGQETANVKLTGRLPYADAKALVERSGVYLCTARETFGIGTLEALACGVPVVGYRWGGQAEIIEQGVDGWLVPPGDIQGLSIGIRWALTNREQLVTPCRAKAEKYPWDKAIAQYAEIYARTAEIGRRRDNPRLPKVSVVVTAYNLDSYLDACLTSIAAQEGSWECIVIDDASPDSCGAIADSWAAKDKRFRVVHNKTNQYLAGARNTAIQEAVGLYVLPLDADDMLAPNTVKTLSQALDQDRTAHVVYGNVKFVDDDGVTPTDYNIPGKEPGYSTWPIPFSFEIQLRGGNCLPYASMYRKEVWQSIGGYRTRNRTAEDADFWLRASSYGFRPKLVTDADTLIYRNRPGSMSRSIEKPHWEYWYPWGRLLELAPAGAITRKQLPIESVDPIVISVVIPVGPNHIKYLLDAVDSVDAQSFRSWECIVVNDSGQKLPNLPSWVRVIESNRKTQLGPAKARNLGIQRAIGAFIVPLDADDYLMPDALKWMIDAHYESNAVVYSDFWEDPEQEGQFKIWENPDYDPHSLTRKGALHAVTSLFPKSVWERVGGYDESLPAWEDWAFQLACADIGVCSRRIAAPLFVYRKHTGQRAKQNAVEFDSSKQGILSKWAELWKPIVEGGRELMACGSCPSGRTIYPAFTGGNNAQSNQPVQQGEVVMLQYVGTVDSSSPWKGPSGTIYKFRVGDPARYVLKVDADHFMRWPDRFVLVNEKSQNGSTAMPEAPILTAPGPPR